MYCPHCDENISELANYDVIYEWVECPCCGRDIWIDYEEYYDDESNEEWGIWIALTYNKYE